MYRRPLTLLLLLAAVLAAGAPRVTAAPPDPFAGDNRLAQRLTLEARHQSVARVLESITQKTGVRLRAEHASAILRVHAFLEQAPLDQTLRRLSTLLRLTWTRVEGKEPAEYLLTETSADVEALRAEQDADRRAIRAHLTRLVLAVNHPEALGNAVEDRAARDWANVASLRVAIQILAALPDSRLDQLVRDGSLQIPVGQMSPQLRNAVELYRSSKPTVVTTRLERVVPTTPLSALVLTLAPGRYGMLSVEARGADRRGGAMGFNPLQPLPKDQAEEQRHWGKRAVNPPPDRPLQLPGRPAAPADPRQPRPRLRLEAALAEFAVANHVNVLADAYDPDYEQGITPVRWDLPPDAAPEQVLDRLCYLYYYTWNGQEPVLLFRQRDWFFARGKEIPADLEQEWRETAKGPGVYTMDQILAMARMNPYQRAKLNRYTGREAYITVNKDVLWRSLTLYDALTPAERAQAQGDGLLVDRFTLAQQRLLEPLIQAVRPGPLDLSQSFQRLLVADEPGTPFTTVTLRFRDGEQRVLKLDRTAKPAPDPWLAPGSVSIRGIPS